MVKRPRTMLALLISMAGLAVAGCSRPLPRDPLAAWLRQHHADIAFDSNLPGRPIVDLRFAAGSDITDDDLVRIEGLTELRSLNLPERITDAGLGRLRGLKKLEWLSVGNTKVSDEGLRIVAGFDRLEWLGLGDTTTDAGLTHLKGLKRLKGLGLDCTAVSDAGLVIVAQFSELSSLMLDSTQVGVTRVPAAFSVNLGKVLELS